jgi:hypothetical protein
MSRRKKCPTIQYHVHATVTGPTAPSVSKHTLFVPSASTETGLASRTTYVERPPSPRKRKLSTGNYPDFIDEHPSPLDLDLNMLDPGYRDYIIESQEEPSRRDHQSDHLLLHPDCDWHQFLFSGQPHGYVGRIAGGLLKGDDPSGRTWAVDRASSMPRVRCWGCTISMQGLSRDRTLLSSMHGWPSSGTSNPPASGTDSAFCLNRQRIQLPLGVEWRILLPCPSEGPWAASPARTPSQN